MGVEGVGVCGMGGRWRIGCGGEDEGVGREEIVKGVGWYGEVLGEVLRGECVELGGGWVGKRLVVGEVEGVE